MSDEELISLLESAREVMRTQIAPQLGGDGRYDSLMVANALSIAARRLRFHDDAERAELGRLRALYGDRTAGLGELRRRLAAELRSAAIERPGDRAEALFEHLREAAAAQTAITNPRALASQTRG